MSVQRSLGLNKMHAEGGRFLQDVILTFDRSAVSRICSFFYMFLKDVKKRS